MSDKKNDLFGGIKVKNTDKININFICALCDFLLLIPTQLLCCGTRLCRWCANKGLPDSEPFICPFCNSEQPRKETALDRGCEREMNLENIKCYSCTWSGLFKEYKDHLQQNHADFECVDCHERFYAKNMFEEHRQEICDYRCIPCGVPDCIELIRWSQMHAHYLAENHQKKLLEFITQFIPNNHNSANMNYLTNQSSNITKTIDDLNGVQNKIETISAQADFVSNQCSQSRLEYGQMTSTCSQLVSKTKETVEKFNETSNKMAECIQSQVELEKELTAVNQSYSVSQYRSLDENASSTFTFNKTREEIISPFSTSGLFKTASYGYLFNLRVCSTISNSNYEQGFLSVFISLCRGTYDAILQFPFPYDIYVCLCDQSDQKKHIISSIKSKAHPIEFTRPSSERNNEIGIIEFCRLDQLTKEQSIYLKNNVFFIRIFIDFLNIGSYPFNQ